VVVLIQANPLPKTAFFRTSRTWRAWFGLFRFGGETPGLVVPDGAVDAPSPLRTLKRGSTGAAPRSTPIRPKTHSTCASRLRGLGVVPGWSNSLAVGGDRGQHLGSASWKKNQGPCFASARAGRALLLGENPLAEHATGRYWAASPGAGVASCGPTCHAA